MVIYTWKTKKTKKGFQYKVSKVIPLKKPVKGYYARTTTVKKGLLTTRARAKSQAQRWVRYYN